MELELLELLGHQTQRRYKLHSRVPTEHYVLMLLPT